MTVGQGTPLMGDFGLKIPSLFLSNSSSLLYFLSCQNNNVVFYPCSCFLPFPSQAFLIKFYLGVSFKLTQSLKSSLFRKSMRNWISFKNLLHSPYIMKRVLKKWKQNKGKERKAIRLNDRCIFLKDRLCRRETQ